MRWGNWHVHDEETLDLTEIHTAPLRDHGLAPPHIKEAGCICCPRIEFVNGIKLVMHGEATLQ